MNDDAESGTREDASAPGRDAAAETAHLLAASERRGHEMQTLLEVSAAVASTLELEPLLDLILAQLRNVVSYSGATLCTVDGDEWLIAASAGGSPERASDRGERLPLRRAGPTWDAIAAGEPLIIADVRADTPAAIHYRAINAALMEGPSHREIRTWMAVPLAQGGHLSGMLTLSRDEPDAFTPHHAALALAFADQAALAIEHARRFEEERQTAKELASLLDVSRNLASTLELEPLLGLILDQLRPVVDFTSCGVVASQDGELRTLEYRGPLQRADVVARRPLIRRDSPISQAARRREPTIIGDILDDTPLARDYRASVDEDWLRAVAGVVRAWMRVPLLHKDRSVGALLLTHATPHYYTARHAELAMAVANQAAAAIENARLFAQERQTAQELASLLAVSQQLASTLEVEPLLDVLLEQLKLVADYRSAAISVVAEERIRELRRRTREGETMPPRDVPLADAAGWWPVLARGEVILCADVQGDEPLARAYRATAARIAPAQAVAPYPIRAWLGVPLIAKERVLGAIVLSHEQAGFYTERHATLATAIATQAAAAIENARLHSEAQKLAALEERGRLARDLHDSVSQALFGIGLGARTARTLLERNAAGKALESVDYVVSLADAGMAEMRALLFELRPESLATEGLVAALGKQATVLRLRHEIAVELSLCAEPDVPIAIKEALYRIAQEALHNIVKHARAGAVSVQLACDGGDIVLTVADDGIGFDTSAAFPGHIGRHTMRERAERVGGSITVASAPGAGTRVRVVVSVAR